MGKNVKRKRVEVVKRPSTFSAWFHLADPGEINLGWPRLHLYEVSNTGIPTPLTEEEIDELVKDVREALAGWSLQNVEAYVIGGGRVLTYQREGMPDMLLSLVPIEYQWEMVAQADYLGRN